MRIAVIGAGSMGCMLGAYLQEGGADVLLTVRRKELMDVLNDKGLSVRMYEGDGSSVMNVKVRAAVDLSSEGVMDALLIMVKGPDTKAAMEGAKPLIGKDTKVKDEKPLEVVEAYVRENTTELVDPLDVQKKVSKIKEKRDTLLTELDTQIKVSNATTFVEF